MVLPKLNQRTPDGMPDSGGVSPGPAEGLPKMGPGPGPTAQGVPDPDMLVELFTSYTSGQMDRNELIMELASLSQGEGGILSLLESLDQAPDQQAPQAGIQPVGGQPELPGGAPKPLEPIPQLTAPLDKRHQRISLLLQEYGLTPEDADQMSTELNQNPLDDTFKVEDLPGYGRAGGYTINPLDHPRSGDPSTMSNPFVTEGGVIREFIPNTAPGGNPAGDLIQLTIGDKNIGTSAASWDEAAQAAERMGFNPDNIVEALRVQADDATRTFGSTSREEPDWDFEEEPTSTLPTLEGVPQTVWNASGQRVTNPQITNLIAQARAAGYKQEDYQGNMNNAVRAYVESGFKNIAPAADQTLPSTNNVVTNENAVFKSPGVTSTNINYVVDSSTQEEILPSSKLAGTSSIDTLSNFADEPWSTPDITTPVPVIPVEGPDHTQTTGVPATTKIYKWVGGDSAWHTGGDASLYLSQQRGGNLWKNAVWSADGKYAFDNQASANAYDKFVTSTSGQNPRARVSDTPTEVGQNLEYFKNQMSAWGTFFAPDFVSTDNMRGKESYVRAYVLAAAKDWNEAHPDGASIGGFSEVTFKEDGGNILIEERDGKLSAMEAFMAEGLKSWDAQLKEYQMAQDTGGLADIPGASPLMGDPADGQFTQSGGRTDWSQFPYMEDMLKALTDEAKQSEILASTVVQAIADMEKLQTSEDIASAQNATSEAIAALREEGEMARAEINEKISTGVALGVLDQEITLAAQKEAAANALSLYQLSGEMPAIDAETGKFVTDTKGNILTALEGQQLGKALPAQQLDLSREELAQDRELRMTEMFGRILEQEPVPGQEGQFRAKAGQETLEAAKWGFTKALQTAEVTGKMINYNPRTGQQDQGQPYVDTFEARRWAWEKDHMSRMADIEQARVEIELQGANLNAELAASEQTLAASIEGGKLTEAVAARRQKMLLEQETELRARDQMRINALISLSDPATMLFAKRYGLIDGFETALGITFGDDIIDPPTMLPPNTMPTAQSLAGVSPAERRIMLAEWASTQDISVDAALSKIQEHTPGSRTISRPSVLGVAR